MPPRAAPIPTSTSLATSKPPSVTILCLVSRAWHTASSSSKTLSTLYSSRVLENPSRSTTSRRLPPVLPSLSARCGSRSPHRFQCCRIPFVRLNSAHLKYDPTGEGAFSRFWQIVASRYSLGPLDLPLCWVLPFVRVPDAPGSMTATTSDVSDDLLSSSLRHPLLQAFLGTTDTASAIMAIRHDVTRVTSCCVFVPV